MSQGAQHCTGGGGVALRTTPAPMAAPLCPVGVQAVGQVQDAVPASGPFLVPLDPHQMTTSQSSLHPVPLPRKPTGPPPPAPSARGPRAGGCASNARQADPRSCSGSRGWAPQGPQPPPFPPPLLELRTLGSPGTHMVLRCSDLLRPRAEPQRSPPEGDRSEQCVNLHGQQGTILAKPAGQVLGSLSSKEAETAPKLPNGLCLRTESGKTGRG